MKLSSYIEETSLMLRAVKKHQTCPLEYLVPTTHKQGCASRNNAVPGYFEILITVGGAVMKIEKNVIGSLLCLKLDGRLDAATAPQLTEEIDSLADDIDELVFDFEKLSYISSAGLRVLLLAQKKMQHKRYEKDRKEGKMTIKNVSHDVMNIMKMTRFKDIFSIE